MTDLLTLYAEVAVGFTGFAAIVSALGVAPSHADMRLDRLRLRNLVEIGVCVVLAALLPMLLTHASDGTQWPWRISAGILTGFYVSLFVLHVRRNRDARVADLAGYSRAGSLALYLMGIAGLGVLLVAQAAPSLVDLQVAYGVSLFFMVAMLGLYFVRIAASLLTHNVGDGG